MSDTPEMNSNPQNANASEGVKRVFTGQSTGKPAFGRKTAGQAESQGAEADASQAESSGPEQASAPGGDPSGTAGAHKSGPEEPKAQRASMGPEDHKMTPDQEKVYSDLLVHILRNGQWGYKGITDPTSKEISFQSEKVAERLYGYLNRHDPKKADKLWEENTGHTPSQKFHEKIKGQTVTQDAGQAMPELKGRVDSITKGIKQLRENEVTDMQTQQLPQLMHMLGETDQRKIDYRRKALQQTFQNDKAHQDNGLAVLKTFTRGLAQGREGVLNWRRENQRGKTIHQSIKDVKGNVKQSKNDQVRVAVNQGATPGKDDIDMGLGPEFENAFSNAFGGAKAGPGMKAGFGASMGTGAASPSGAAEGVSPAGFAASAMKNGQSMNMGTVGATVAAKMAVNMVDRITGRASVQSEKGPETKKSGIDLQEGMQKAAQHQQNQGQGPSLGI